MLLKHYELRDYYHQYLKGNYNDDINFLDKIHSYENHILAESNKKIRSLLQQFPLPGNFQEFEEILKTLTHSHQQNSTCLYQYIKNACSSEEMAFYIRVEQYVDGYFDDFLALCQLGLIPVLKLNIANNYWDEMGLGNCDEMHTVLFNKALKHANLILNDKTLPDIDDLLESSNRFFLYGLRRNYKYRLLGSLFLIEFIAPNHFVSVVSGLKRLNFPKETIFYNELHIEVDDAHSKGFLNSIKTVFDTNIFEEIYAGILDRYFVATQYAEIMRKKMGELMKSNTHSIVINKM